MLVAPEPCKKSGLTQRTNVMRESQVTPRSRLLPFPTHSGTFVLVEVQLSYATGGLRAHARGTASEDVPPRKECRGDTHRTWFFVRHMVMMGMSLTA